MLCKDTGLNVGKMFTAKLLWMDDNKLVAGKNYFLNDDTLVILSPTVADTGIINIELNSYSAVISSFADLAVKLVDASKGVLVQTKRHTRICSLMGIKVKKK